VNLEYLPDPQGAPKYVPFVPSVRDLAWQGLYHQYKGQIDEQFAFKAYDNAPLVASTTMDAKVATSAMANNMMVWAEFGRPNESVWGPPRDESASPNHGLYPGGYYLVSAEPGASLKASVIENEKARLAAAEAKKPEEGKKPALVSWKGHTDKLWKGWLLPASDADTWFVAGSAGYYRTLQSKDVKKAVEAEWVRYRGLKLAGEGPDNRFRVEEIKGELFLDALRQKMGDEPFLKLMSDYFASNTTKTVTAQSFLDAAKTLFELADPGDDPAYLPGDIRDHLASAVIVYGTVREAGTNRYAAEQLQTRYRDRYQREVPIYKDFEATDVLIGHKDVVFIGRPETNSALAAWREKMGLDYPSAVFKVDGKTYASERNSLVFASKNPLDPAHMAVVYAGNSPLETARSLNAEDQKPRFALEDGKSEEPTPRN